MTDKKKIKNQIHHGVSEKIVLIVIYSSLNTTYTIGFSFFKKQFLAIDTRHAIKSYKIWAM